MKIKRMHTMLTILQRIFLCVFIISSCAVAQLQLKIDTAFIIDDGETFNDRNAFRLYIKYILCNKGEKKIKHIDGLWYPDKFHLSILELDSTLREKLEISNTEELGNTKVYLYENGSLLDIADVPIIGDCPMPNTTKVVNRIKLRPHKCFWSWVHNGFFGRVNWFNGKVEKDSSYIVQIEYNTLFQRTDGVRIWRGKLMSNKYSIKF